MLGVDLEIVVVEVDLDTVVEEVVVVVVVVVHLIMLGVDLDIVVVEEAELAEEIVGLLMVVVVFVADFQQN